MSLGKQAKVLTDNQQKAVLGCIGVNAGEIMHRRAGENMHQ